MKLLIIAFLGLFVAPFVNYFLNAPAYAGLPAKPEIPETPEIIFSSTNKDVERFVLRWQKVAKSEQKKYGIPVSIKLAQGIIESNKGKSRLAVDHNNYFGIKAFKKKAIPEHIKSLPVKKTSFNDTDDAVKFWHFNTAWDSWRYHSELITTGAYQVCLRYNDKDFEAWAKCLKKVGYATQKTYAETLINLIETYNLQMLD